MVFLVPFVFFCFVAVHAAIAIRREAKVLAEFGQSTALAGIVWLFPLGPLLLEFGPRTMQFPLPQSLALACYLPAIAVARKQIRALEAARNERTRGAQHAAERVFGIAVAGVLYVLVSLGMAIAMRSAQGG